jgi:hypothetical protein
MQFGAFLPLGAFVVVVGWVAIRMLSLARRTRELPETFLGLGLAALAVVSIPGAALGRAPATTDLLIGEVAFAASMGSVAVGIVLLYLFNLRVFRWHSPVARVCVGVAALAVSVAAGAIGSINFSIDGIDVILPRTRPYIMGLMVALLVLFAWSGIESFSHHARLRRRLALGMADPVLVNRFLLWGISSVTATAMVAGLLVCSWMGMVIFRETVPQLGISLAGSVMSVTWYLTFFAPERYKARVRARAAARSPSSSLSR